MGNGEAVAGQDAPTCEQGSADRDDAPPKSTASTSFVRSSTGPPPTVLSLGERT